MSFAHERNSMSGRSIASVWSEHTWYDPYGNMTVLLATWYPASGNVSQYGWRFNFQGGRLDVTTGWYDFRNRDYIPTQGTWAERDPLGFGGGDLNLYRLEFSSVAGSLDPIGEGEKAATMGQRKKRSRQTALEKYNQDLLDYHRRIMQQILVVGEEIYCEGVSNFEKSSPWYKLDPKTYAYRTKVKIGSDLYGINGAATNNFPKLWPDLARAISFSQGRYKRFGGYFGQQRVGLISPSRVYDGSSINVPYAPGIYISKESFYSNNPFNAVSALIHEPLHDADSIYSCHNKFWDHWYMRNIVPATGVDPDKEYGSDALTLFYNFAITVKLRDGRTLWQAILDEAGPRPTPPMGLK